MTISVVSCKKREIKKKISELINFVGWEPKKNSTVLLKPNLCAIKPKNESEITEPLIIEAIINFLKGFNCKIIIAETNNLGPSDKSYTFDDIIRNSGYRRFEKYENVTIVDLEKGPIIKKKIRGVTLEIPDLMNSVDHYINIAKIKTHFVTEVSLCLKNQMGIVPEPERMRYHREDLDKNIAYLSTVLKPDLCIVDGIVGMEGKGPHWGKSKKSNILIAGTNIVETDSITSALIGIDPSTVKHLKLAKDIGAGKFYTQHALINKFKTPYEPSSEVSFHFGKLFVYMEKGKPCNCCGRAVEFIKKSAMKNPIYLAKLLNRYFFKKTAIIIGKVNKANIPDEYLKNVYCIGHCTKEFAEKNHYKHLDECPPSEKDVIELFFKK